MQYNTLGLIEKVWTTADGYHQRLQPECFHCQCIVFLEEIQDY